MARHYQRTRALLSCLALSLCAALVRAQQPVAAELPATVTVAVDCGVNPPTHIQLSRWAWLGRFRRVEGWQPVAGVQTVAAVRFAPAAEDDAVRVHVSVLLGAHMDEEKQVTSYLLREGEQTSAAELTRYGVAPCTLKVVRIRAVESRPPEVVNQTTSLEVLGVEPKTDESFPAYKIRVRNNATKSVAALFLYLYTDNAKGSATKLSYNPLDMPLIEPGAVHELFAIGNGSAGQATAETYRPAPPRRFIIATVVFADGSYEGEAARAAHVRALWQGRKTQLARVLALIAQTLDEPDADSSPAVARFKAQVSALDERVDPAAVSALRAEFPTPDAKGDAELAAAMQFTLHQTKTELVHAVEAFERGPHTLPGAETFRGWLRETRGAYERWRARL
jgi:hypothetical protein